MIAKDSNAACISATLRGHEQSSTQLPDSRRSRVAQPTGVSAEAAIPQIAIGLVGFLAATTQGPITAFIIVMRRFAMVLSLMATALPLPRVALVDANVFFGPRLGDPFHSGR